MYRKKVTLKVNNIILMVEQLDLPACLLSVHSCVTARNVVFTAVIFFRTKIGRVFVMRFTS